MNEENKSIEVLSPKAEGFVERIVPKQTADAVFLFECPSCDGKHFRHAGYLIVLLPFLRSGNEKRMQADNEQVMICVKCRKAYIWEAEQMYDVSEHVDVEAWEKAERELQKATGPGGQC